MSRFEGEYRGIKYNRAGLKDDVKSITVRQVENLIDLADILRHTPPPEFEMAHFADFENEDAIPADLKLKGYGPFNDIEDYPSNIAKIGAAGGTVAHKCGTSCCAVGTAAFYNIGKVRPKEGWAGYSARVFGVSGNSWEWCFSGEWSVIDNTPKGAAARILHLLMNGVSEYYISGNVDTTEYQDKLTVPVLPKVT